MECSPAPHFFWKLCIIIPQTKHQLAPDIAMRESESSDRNHAARAEAEALIANPDTPGLATPLNNKAHKAVDGARDGRAVRELRLVNPKVWQICGFINIEGPTNLHGKHLTTYAHAGTGPADDGGEGDGRIVRDGAHLYVAGRTRNQLFSYYREGEDKVMVIQQIMPRGM